MLLPPLVSKFYFFAIRLCMSCILMLSFLCDCIYVNSEWLGTFTENKLFPRHYTSRVIVKHDILNTQTVILQISPHISAACSARPLFMEFLFVFVALRPMSTAMVIAGRSVHLTALFP